VNLTSNEMVGAIQRLANTEDFKAFRVGLGEVAENAVHQAVSSGVNERVEATSRAASIRDLWVHIEAVCLNTRPQAVARPKTPPAPTAAPTK
jgi:hypothetical protein